jgi:zinc transport system ATP-binding protein
MSSGTAWSGMGHALASRRRNQQLSTPAGVNEGHHTGQRRTFGGAGGNGTTMTAAAWRRTFALGPPAPLTVEHAVCRYGTVTAVDGVTLELHPGQHAALVGANGSGKSTLLRAVQGLHPLAVGRILLDGQAARTSKEWAARRRRVAWVPQRLSSGTFPLLVSELLDSSGDRAAAEAGAELLGIEDLLERPVSGLSGGQLQRAFLARALGCIARGAGLLLADEPTAALDFAAQELVADLLDDLTVTVLVVSHDQAIGARAQRRFEMAAGQLRELR